MKDKVARSVGRARRPKTDGPTAAASLDAITIELKTGLSIADFEALAKRNPPEERASIARKFASQFDRLARESINKLCMDLLNIFVVDPDIAVRSQFAKSIRTSPYLPVKIAERLARDDIDVAASMLRDSPVLTDSFLGDIVRTMPEAYALVIADRQPLREGLVETLIEHKGTKRVVARLLDNGEAQFSDAALLSLNQWGQSDQEIARSAPSSTQPAIRLRQSGCPGAG